MSDDSRGSDGAAAIAAVRHWVDAVVIVHNFCPFAPATVRRSGVRYCSVAADITGILDAVQREISALEADDTLDTSLIVVTDGLAEFEDYLDMLFIVEAHLTDQQQDELYQIATFHPAYCFEGNSPDDLDNYTNRAPFPVFQLLKESSVSRVLNQHPDPESIPETNIRHVRSLGGAEIEAIKAASSPT